MADRARWALVAGVVLWSVAAVAQGASNCRTAQVIPLTGVEPPAKIVIDPPLAEPLATRGVVIIQYCAENLHLVPVFGPNTQAVSPRIGHVHVSLDDAKWVWADASGEPIILQGLAPGKHTVFIDLVNANHHSLDKSSISFVVPESAGEKHAEGR